VPAPGDERSRAGCDSCRGGATGWSYGVLDLRVCDGEITDFAWASMRTLRSRYSDDGADVRAA